MIRLIPVAIAAVVLLLPVSAASAGDGGRPTDPRMTGSAERGCAGAAR